MMEEEEYSHAHDLYSSIGAFAGNAGNEGFNKLKKEAWQKAEKKPGGTLILKE